MCSGARQFPRPIADIVAAINGAAQTSHLRATVEDLTRQRGEGAKFICYCSRCLEFTRVNGFPPPRLTAPALHGLSGRSATGTDNTHGQVAPSVAQDSDRGSIHAANEAVSETKRHDD